MKKRQREHIFRCCFLGRGLPPSSASRGIGGFHLPKDISRCTRKTKITPGARSFDSLRSLRMTPHPSQCAAELCSALQGPFPSRERQEWATVTGRTGGDSLRPGAPLQSASPTAPPEGEPRTGTSSGASRHLSALRCPKSTSGLRLSSCFSTAAEKAYPPVTLAGSGDSPL